MQYSSTFIFSGVLKRTHSSRQLKEPKIGWSCCAEKLVILSFVVKGDLTTYREAIMEDQLAVPVSNLWK